MNERVLIVDDDVDILESLEDWLVAQRAEVITATKGQKALQLLRSQQINLVMLDIQLPDIDGLSYYTRLRRKG